MEVIDGAQYSCTWSWVKVNTLDVCLGVNAPFGASPTAPLIVLTAEHFIWLMYNQERACNLSRVRYLTEEAKTYNGEKALSSRSGAGKTGQLCVEE